VLNQTYVTPGGHLPGKLRAPKQAVVQPALVTDPTTTKVGGAVVGRVAVEVVVASLGVELLRRVVCGIGGRGEHFSERTTSGIQRVRDVRVGW
jgi:hypothetical protein